METFCRPPMEQIRWRPIPARYTKTCLVQESPTVKNFPCLQDTTQSSQVLDYASLARIVTQTSLEMLSRKQRRETVAKYIEWQLPVYLNELTYQSSKTYAIGCEVFFSHFVMPSKENTRRFVYDKYFLSDLENLCYTDTSNFLRQKIRINMMSDFVRLLSPDPLKCSLSVSQLITLVREAIANCVQRPSQINQELKNHFETTWLPTLYTTVGPIQFPCPNALRLWLSTLTFDTNNEIIIFPPLDNRLLHRLWASTNATGKIFDNEKFRRFKYAHECDIDEDDEDDDEDDNHSVIELDDWDLESA